MTDAYMCPACGCISPLAGSDPTRCPKCNVALAEFAVTCAGCKKVSQGPQIKNLGYCPKCGDRYSFNTSPNLTKSPIIRDNKYTFLEILNTYCPDNNAKRSQASKAICALIFSKGAPFTHITSSSKQTALTIDGINYVGFRTTEEADLIVVRASTMAHIEMVLSGYAVPDFSFLGDLTISQDAWKIWSTRIQHAISEGASDSTILKVDFDVSTALTQPEDASDQQILCVSSAKQVIGGSIGHYEQLYNSPEAASFLITLRAAKYARLQKSNYDPAYFVCSKLALGNERICRLAYTVSKLIESLEPGIRFYRLNPTDFDEDIKLSNVPGYIKVKTIPGFRYIRHFGMVYSNHVLKDEFFISFNAVNQVINEQIRPTQLAGPEYQLLSEVNLPGDVITTAIAQNAVQIRDESGSQLESPSLLKVEAKVDSSNIPVCSTAQRLMQVQGITIVRVTALIVLLTFIGTGAYVFFSPPHKKSVSWEDVFKTDSEIENFMVGFRRSERESDFYESIPDLKEYPVIDALNITYCARDGRRLLFWQAVGAPCLGPSKMASLVGVVSNMDTLETKQLIDHKLEEECLHAKGSHTQVFGSSRTNLASSIGRVVLSADCKKYIQQVDQEQRYDRQQREQNKEYIKGVVKGLYGIDNPTPQQEKIIDDFASHDKDGRPNR